MPRALQGMRNDLQLSMAIAAGKISAEEFETVYGRLKPGYEYWFGEAVAKAMPTSVHGILQGILIGAFKSLGYRAGSEIRLKIDPSFLPIPDVCAQHARFETPYPTKPVEVVVEILSPEDSFSTVTRKCAEYARLQIPDILVIDPEERTAWYWSGEWQRLQRVDFAKGFDLAGGARLALDSLFQQLDDELNSAEPVS